MSKAVLNSYAVLSKQAPPQKVAPTQPLPPLPHSRISPVWDSFSARPRSSTFSNISAWALNIQPGSPAPLSPSASSPRRLSVPSVRVSSASFLNLLDTPSTAQKAAYNTPVVVEFPTSPRTAGLPQKDKDLVALYGIPAPPMPKKNGRVLNRVRSWSVFGRPKAAAGTKPKADATLTAAAEIASRKKEGYNNNNNKNTRRAHDRPLPLAAQLELAQLMDGGSMDHRIKAHMKERARGEDAGVGDVWRDGAGGIWLDQEEEWEYAHLLGGDVGAGTRAMGEPEWVDFEACSPVDGGDSEERRGSVSTQSSDLDPGHLMQVPDTLANFGGNVVSAAAHKPGASVRSGSHPISQQTTRPGSSGITRPGSSGSVRRRPAPLVLPPPAPSTKSPINPDQIRRDFLENSFQPEVKSTPRAQKKVRRGSLAVLPGYTNVAAASTETFASSGTRRTVLKKPSLLNVFKGRRDASA
ncbi:hypothetical protein NEOLEDRAFT_357491 [Neolentinus lepideus HHB14362 ss-1]|uniref:Uncharacterized protein n=1 Tax=Neolentinus lepideus HHB14362 ss-1 TaxID=1314782 RepID=A0A165SLD4_9AGAM|nr:hypothetical protein NEOLEDRAFT_357491 [Neolentinus lepideus HHB14362 ss-1]